MLRLSFSFFLLISPIALAGEGQKTQYGYPIVTQEDRDRFGFTYEGQTVYNLDTGRFEINRDGVWTARNVEADVLARTRRALAGEGVPK